jgi:hypothetical protein
MSITTARPRTTAKCSRTERKAKRASVSPSLDPLGELRAVGGVAHGGGRDKGDLGDAARRSQLQHPADGLECALDRVRGEHAGAREAAREPGMVLEVVDDGEVAVVAPLRDEAADGVRADVDRGEAVSHPHRAAAG